MPSLDVWYIQNCFLFKYEKPQIFYFILAVSVKQKVQIAVTVNDRNHLCQEGSDYCLYSTPQGVSINKYSQNNKSIKVKTILYNKYVITIAVYVKWHIHKNIIIIHKGYAVVLLHNSVHLLKSSPLLESLNIWCFPGHPVFGHISIVLTCFQQEMKAFFQCLNEHNYCIRENILY